ncbi:hypothetical protein AURDEDRAFT_177757 [Auricularia subglabra TFB-10046 SS5]|uniref:Uncharacterized protein n=1 Tax=Auricularia subglabra (strain TFB-10046 / SS5) TaxID=717982 RepID=J0D3B0_AURST|nr:hypothetical protein AURDEDRAFT_177757 [Auricularia subglabra TFB-10046 SS5]
MSRVAQYPTIFRGEGIPLALPELGHQYPDLTTHPNATDFHCITRPQVFAALTAPNPDKAPGHSGVLNRAVLWAWDVAEDEMFLLAGKPEKPDYTRHRAHRLIHCLERMGKTLEIVETRIVAHFTLEHGLVAEAQSGGVPGPAVEGSISTRVNGFPFEFAPSGFFPAITAVNTE